LGRWQRSSRLPQAVTHAFDTSFGPYYAWADNLAVFYAGLFRSAYLLRYVFSTLAVLFTVIGSFSPFAWQGFLLQVLSVGALIGVVLLEKKKRWHLRSLEYRLFAEQLRLLYFSFPLGGGVERISELGSEIRMPPRWITRQLRGIVREAGLVSAKITPEYLRAHRDLLCRANVKEQIEYHRALGWNAVMAGRLYRLSMFFFLLGILAVVSRAAAAQWMPQLMVHGAADGGKPLLYWIKISTVLFPALGMTLANIRGHGEFARMGSRSATMLRFLEARKEALIALESAKPAADWEATSLVTRKIAHEMLGEVIDWRTLIAGKGLSLPV
jgi:hypothetical protein